MKIRILDNSIRLRLTQSEVDTLDKKGIVEAKVQFGLRPNEVLRYSLESATTENLSARYADGHIKVFVPVNTAKKWAASNQVGMEAAQKLDEKNFLRILVEKDFKCLTDRPNEDEDDHFPNPNLNC